MARNFHFLIDSLVSAQVVRDDLVNAHGFMPDSDGLLVSPLLNVVVRPSTKGDEFLAEPGIAKSSLKITLMPSSKAESTAAARRATLSVAAALLRTFAGDAALTAQDSSTCVLRINGVVYVDRNQVPEDWLAADDVAPSPLVVGIPAIAD